MRLLYPGFDISPCPIINKGQFLDYLCFFDTSFNCIYVFFIFKQMAIKNGVLYYLDSSKNEKDCPCVVVNKIKKASRNYKATNECYSWYC